MGPDPLGPGGLGRPPGLSVGLPKGLRGPPGSPRDLRQPNQKNKKPKTPIFKNDRDCVGPARPPTPNIVQNLGCSCGFGAARAKPWWPFQRAEKYVFVKPAGSTPTNIQGPCLGLRGVCISALTVPPLLFTSPLLSHPRGDSSPHLLRQHIGPIFHHLMIRAVPLSRALHQVLFPN